MKRLLFTITLLALLFTGCATLERVQPWEREVLADPIMQLEPDPLEASLDEHIFGTREGSSGGSGAVGGGCGCN
mgnify:CR=1 FL=1